jgi:glycosyltransferase involved in cell wall biosynthesis
MPNADTITAPAAPVLRVLHLSLWFTPAGGGLQAYLRNVLQAFDGARDVKFFGAAVHPGEAPPGFAGPAHVGAPGRSLWRNTLAFARHVAAAARAADLVQIHGIYGAQFMVGAPLCWLLRVPYVVCPHNALAPWMLGQKAWRKRLFFGFVGGFLLRRAACVLATSPLEAEALERRFPGSRVRLVLAGVPVPGRPRVALLGEAPLPALRVLYLGSFDPWKRVPMLVRAVAALRRDGLDARLVVAGKGPPQLEQPVDDAIARAGMPEAITRAGYVAGDRKWELLRASHVLALPSVTDSYSIATAEALAEGLPVVITGGAGAAPDVRRHDCGTVIPPDDEPALVDALRQYADPAVLRARALNAHRYARECLDLGALRANLTALYRAHVRGAA